MNNSEHTKTPTASSGSSSGSNPTNEKTPTNSQIVNGTTFYHNPLPTLVLRPPIIAPQRCFPCEGAGCECHYAAVNDTTTCMRCRNLWQQCTWPEEDNLYTFDDQNSSISLRDDYQREAMDQPTEMIAQFNAMTIHQTQQQGVGQSQIQGQYGGQDDIKMENEEHMAASIAKAGLHIRGSCGNQK